MTAVITGPGLGLERNSGSLLGASGQLGSAALGLAGNQVYVNAATGNLVVRASDQYLMGLGPDVSIARTYNSQGTLSENNGQLWSDDYSRHVLVSSLTGTVNTAGSTISRVTGDGAVVVYTYNGAAYVANEGGGAYDTMSFNAGTGLWKWTDGASQTVETYDSTGRLTSVTDHTGLNTLTLSYGGSMTTITTAASGGVTQNIYLYYNTINGVNELASSYVVASDTTSYFASFTLYNYDSLNRLTSEVTELTPQYGTVSPTAHYDTTYGYQGSTNQLTSISQSDGSTLTIGYNGSGQASSITQALGAGANTQLTFDYSTSGQATVTDNANNHTTFGYNSLGQLTSLLTPVGQTEAVTYNTMGDVWTITQNGVLRHTYTYDGAGNQLSDVDAMGDEIDRTYTSTNQLLTSTQYTGPGTSGTALTTTYAYDAQNNLAFVVSPNSEVTQYLYSSSAPGIATTVLHYGAASPTPSSLTYGSLLSWINSFPDWSDVARTDYTLDARGGITQATSWEAQLPYPGVVMLHPVLRTQYFVDYTGRTLSAHNVGQDQYGSTLSFQSWSQTRDGLGRILSATDTNGQTVNYIYSDNGSGEVVTATNTVAGTVTTSTYNLVDQLVSTQIVAPNAPTATTTYAYNSLGQLRATTDPTGVTTYFVYDANGRKVADITGDGSITTYGYNADGLLNQTVVHDYKLSSSQLALLTTSGYSAPVLMSSVLPVPPSSDPNGANDVANYSYYDADGRLIESIDAAGTITTYRYDNASRLTSTTVYASQIPVATLLTYKSGLPTAPVAPTPTAGLDRINTLTYDNDGRVIQSVIDSGAGHLNLTTTTTYDKFGNVVAVTDPENNISRNLYNLAGQLIYKIDGAGDVTLYTYDLDNNLLTSHIYATPLTSTQLAALTPTLLATQAPQALISTIAGTEVLNSFSDPNGYLPSDNIQTQNTYDSRGRLSNSLILGTQTYDAAGNLIAVSDPDVVAYNASGSITRYIYDGNGRRIYTINGAGNVTRTVYDPAGRIIQTIAYATPLSSYQLYSLDPATMASSYTVASLAALVTSFVTASANKDQVTSNVYDGNGRLAFTISPSSTTGMPNNLGVIDHTVRATEYDYDAEGRVVQTTVYATPITQAATYSLSYVQGQVAGHTSDAANRVTRATYNSAGQLAFSIDAVGGTTSYTYDAFGNVVQETHFSTAFTGNGIQTTAGMQTWASANAATTDRTLRFAYDAANRQIFSVDAAGYVTQTFYDPDGLVVATRGYANAVNLTAWPATPTTAAITALLTPSDASDHISRTVYDSAGRAVYTVDANGDVARKVYDGDNKVLATVAYAKPISSAAASIMQLSLANMPGYIIQSTGQDEIIRYAYGDSGRLNAIIDSTGGVTFFNYDNDSRLISRDSPGSQPYFVTNYSPLIWSYSQVARWAQQTPGYDETTSYTYDSAGRQITKTDALGYVTTNQYDAFGNLVKVTDPRGNSGFFYYNQLNQMTVQVDAVGYLTTTKYSIGGQVVEVTRGAQNFIGISTDYIPLPPSIPGDETTSIARDKLDRIVSTTDAMGYTESYQLDVFGDRTQVTNKLHGVTNNIYDARDLLTSSTLHEESYLSTGVRERDEATGVVNTFSYDAFGNRTAAVEAAGLADQRTTTYEYDGLNRVISQTGDTLDNTYTPAGGLGTGAIPSFASAAPKQTTTYDTFGNVILSVDANGDKTFTYYDQANRKIAEVNPVGTLSTWAYDAFSNVTKARVYGSTVALPAMPGGAPPPVSYSSSYHEIDYGYDLKNEQTATAIQIWNNTPEIDRGEYVDGEYSFHAYQGMYSLKGYDSDGNVWYSQDYNSAITYNIYDKNNRLTDSFEAARSTWVDQTSVWQNVARDTSYQYNSDGNVTTINHHAGLYNLTYDPVTYRPNGVVAQDPSSVSDDRITTFTYDKNGNRTSETRANVIAAGVLNGGAIISETGDATISYSYNALGEVLSVTQAAPSILAFAGFGPGDQTIYVYDKMGRQIAVRAPSFVDYTGASVTPESKNCYDGLNNLVISTVGAKDADPITLHMTQNSYTHGRLSQSVDAQGNTSKYYYDANGALVETEQTRLTSDSVVLTDYSFNFLDAAGRQSRSFTDEATPSNTVYGDVNVNDYDAYGELKDQTVNGVTKATYGYDGAGRLTSSTADGGVQKFFIYDANGNVTMEIDDAGQGLGGMSISQVIANYLTFGTDTDVNVVNWSYRTKLTATIKTYDADNHLIKVIQPEREIAQGNFATITTSKTYDRFGEVATETDAAGAVTTYSYNTLGKVIQVVQPVVSVTSASGVVSNVNPTLNYYYDLSGRMVATEDVNGFWTTRTLLAGTGYNGSDPTALTVYNNPASTTTGFDVWGNERTYKNELGYVENRTYDKLNRLVSVTQPATPANTIANPTGTPVQLTTSYSYDSLGQRIGQSNSQLVDANGVRIVQTTDYDLQGRVVSQVDYMGHAILTSYAFDAWIYTTGLAIYGGWTTTVRNSNGQVETIKQDLSGRNTYMKDFGGNEYFYLYDAGGRLTQQLSSNGENQTNSYLNTGKLASAVTASLGSNGNTSSTYGYDTAGNRVSEVTSFTPFSSTGSAAAVSYQNATATYDALNRMTSFTDQGQNHARPVTINYEYDAAGNVRRMKSVYTDVVTNLSTTQDYWYLYDSKNRFILTQGSAPGFAGYTGTLITYDAAGERISATSYSPQNYTVGGYTYTYSKQHTENYTYTPSGYLATTTVTDETFDGSLNYLAAVDVRDALGRVTSHQEYNPTLGSNPSFSSTIVYNADSLQTSEVDSTAQSSGATLNTTTSFDYIDQTTGYWDGGQITHSHSTSTLINGGSASAPPESDTVNGFTWTQGALETTIAFTPDVTSSGVVNHTRLFYDAYGHLAVVAIDDGRPRTVAYAYTVSGQVLSRIETTPSSPNPSATSNPEEFYYYLNGVQLGDIGNNGTSQTNYAQAINERQVTPGTGAFRLGGPSAASYAAFGDSYAPIDPTSQGSGMPPRSTNTNYTVQAGDTLQSIAGALWGDSSLWYLIADANGLSGSTTLAAGSALTIPAKVVNVHNSSSTFTVYDPSKAIGNLQPSVQPVAPPSNQHGGCGVLGQILEVVVAAVVVYFTAGAAIHAVAGALGLGSTTALTTIADSAAGGNLLALGAEVGGGAIAGAAGSIAAQTFGLATGIQSQFSWSGVALAALSGGVNGGVSSLLKGVPIPGGDFGRGLVTGAASNAITQGVAVATGLQSKFDWAGVAVGGVVGGVTSALTDNSLTRFSPAGIANAAVAGVAGAIAGAATRSVLTGSDFGDNLIAALPDVIGSTIANAIIGQIVAPSQSAGGSTGNPRAGGGTLPTDSSTLALVAPITLSREFGTQALQNIQLRALALPMLNEDGTISYSVAGGTPLTAHQTDSGAFVRTMLQYAQGIDNGTPVPGQAYAGETSISTGTDVPLIISGSVVNNAWYWTLTNAADGSQESFFPNLGSTHTNDNLWGGLSVGMAPALDRVSQNFMAANEGVFSLDTSIVGGARAFSANPGGFLSASGSALYDFLSDPAGAGYKSGQAFRRNLDAAWNNGTIDLFASKGVGTFASGFTLPAPELGVLKAEGAAETGAYRSVVDKIGCFVAGTPIHTRNGLKPIEALAVGDFVLSQPDVTGEAGYRRINDTFRFEDKLIFEVAYQGGEGHAETLHTTPNHPFWVKGQGWTAAEHLEHGQFLELRDGREATLISIRDTGHRQTVYNLEVDGFHTYYVGQQGVWVHNTNCGPFRETFDTPEAAIGMVWGEAEYSGFAETHNVEIHAGGFTETHYYVDHNGDKWTVHYNPSTGEYGGAHPSSYGDR